LGDRPSIAACRALGQFFLGLACFTVHFGVEFLKLSCSALDFALALGFVIVGQPTEILFDGAYNLSGFAFDFTFAQHTFSLNYRSFQ
jgi:hypothetical protein